MFEGKTALGVQSGNRVHLGVGLSVVALRDMRYACKIYRRMAGLETALPTETFNPVKNACKRVAGAVKKP